MEFYWNVLKFKTVNFREVSGPKGSLCGLGSMYAAVFGTLATKSKLTTLDYQSMRELMFTEMGGTEDGSSDAELLEQFFEGKFSHIILFYVFGILYIQIKGVNPNCIGG